MSKSASYNTIKKRLITLTSAKDVFDYLGNMWMKKHLITKEEYDELWQFWKENKPTVIKRDMTPEEEEVFGALVEPGTQVEETKAVETDEYGNPKVDNIPF